MEAAALRRWKTFKNNRRAFYSLVIFTLIFIISLLSDVICNDRPLLIVYKGRIMSPVMQYYSEQDFGGEFDIEPQYKSPEITGEIKKHGFIVWPPVRYSFDTVNTELASPAPSSPTTENILGTDDQARDLFARLLYGLRASLLFGIMLSSIGVVTGVTIGAIQGYFGGLVDISIQRFTEMWAGLPILFVLIILSSLVNPTFLYLLCVMALFSWIALAGVVRAEFLRARNFTYVKAAEVMGIRSFIIMFRHIFPNAMISAVSYFPFLVNSSITMLTSLDFLGFGLPPGAPSMGEMLSQAKANLYAPWIWMTAFFSMALILVLITFIGEGMRDAFDSRRS